MMRLIMLRIRSDADIAVPQLCELLDVSRVVLVELFGSQAGGNQTIDRARYV
jgi:hypothetical protein